MRSFFAVYSLPGKILAHLWYLWPKKGEVWASARRRDHGFVHFLYSTIIYAVAAFIMASPHGSSKHVSSADTQQFVGSDINAPIDDFPMQAVTPDFDPIAEDPVQEATFPITDEVASEAPPEADAVEFVSNPVVQEIAPASTQQNITPCSETVTDGCVD